MADNENGALRRVAWREICPWLAIFRTFRLAASFRVLLLSAVAVFITFCGWALFFWAFSVDSRLTEWMGGGNPWQAATEMVPDQPRLPGTYEFGEAVGDAFVPITPKGRPGNPLFGSWAHLCRPAWEIVRLNSDFTGLACLLLCGLWSLATWAFFGGAITRMAAVQLACDERVGLMAAIRFACSRWTSYFFAPLFPAAGILLAALPVCFLGLIQRVDVLVILTAFAWPLALVSGLIMAVLLLGLIFGWPLMWSTISAEGTDNFDALSRCYAYTFQRPLHYLFYAVVAGLFGAVGWLLVENFAAVVVNLPLWASAWGSGADRFTEIVDAKDIGSVLGNAGGTLIRFFGGCVKLLAVGFFFAYFWTATTCIYFLLRRDVDATEMDEVFLDDDTSEQPHDLPPIGTDETGAPVIEDQPEPADDDASDDPPSE